MLDAGRAQHAGGSLDEQTKELFRLASTEAGIRGLAAEQPEGQLLDYKAQPPPCAAGRGDARF